jgi:hypothetical protein
MAYTTVQVSELACNIFSQWAVKSVDTLNLQQLDSNVFKWVFWKGGEIKSITLLVKGSTKTIENLYFSKSTYTKGLILEMPKHKDVTHVMWIDINNGDSALASSRKLSILLRENTDADDFNSFKTNEKDVYIVPLDYIECEGIGVRRRNLLAAA